jgi:hypothetical protein
MTIFFPDISDFQAGLQLQPSTAFVWAKATEGTYRKDGSYLNFKAQAAAKGIPFGAYHFLTAGNGAAQADYAFSVVGPHVPLFVDVEPIVGQGSFPTTSDVNAFTARYRALGGIVKVQYYPAWYATAQGANLASTGLLTIASGYPGSYSDSAPQWNAYSGITPFQWQYTDSFSYAGHPVDFNAYKGTIDQYLVAVGYKSVTPPPPPPPTTSQEDDMQQVESLSVHPDSYVYPTINKGHFRLAMDGFGANAEVRVVVFAGASSLVYDNLVLVKGFHDIAIDSASTSHVTVQRLDAGEFPVGVGAY